LVELDKKYNHMKNALKILRDITIREKKRRRRIDKELTPQNSINTLLICFCPQNLSKIRDF